MIDVRTNKDIKELPVLQDPETFIYIMLNSCGKVKIGKTKNIQQRYQSLSGSNCGGSKIIKCFISEPTYLYTLERIMHNKFDKYRIPNTEWFYNEKDVFGEKLFENASHELQLLFSSDSYQSSNELRKQICEKKKKGELNDN